MTFRRAWRSPTRARARRRSAGRTSPCGAGETVGVIGGTGSGKSTLVNLIPRFYDATEGRVLVFGQRRAHAGPWQQLRGAHRRGAAAGAAVRRARSRRTCAGATRRPRTSMLWEALSSWRRRATLWREKPGRARRFSGGAGRAQTSPAGSSQRLTIARALVRRPDILILDDSASALDYATDARLRQAIASLPDVTVFIVSQRASSVQPCGPASWCWTTARVIAQGTHEAAARVLRGVSARSTPRSSSRKRRCGHEQVGCRGRRAPAARRAIAAPRAALSPAVSGAAHGAVARCWRPSPSR